MRRPIAAVALLTVAMLVSACAASQAPGWTFAPPTPSPTVGPSQSAGDSGAPSASGSAPAASASAPAASEGASAGASAPAASGGGSAGGNVVNLTAQGVQWTTTTLQAPANTPFTIHFDNQDAGMPHNIVIKDATGADLFTGDLVTGPTTVDYKVPALKAGTYTFICAVHPQVMTGTLKVGS